MILRAFGNYDGNDHRTLLGALPADTFDFHIDVAVVLVKLADFVQVLLQLDLIEAAGFVHEINGRSALRLHLFAQHLFAEVRISLEVNRAHSAFHPFGDGENHARRATFLVNWIDAKLDADVGESSSLIYFDYFLARFLQLLFVNWLVKSQLDFFAQSLRLDPFGSGDFDLAHDRPCLHRHDHLHAIPFRLSKNANVMNGASLVKRLDVLLDHRIGVGLAHPRAHLRQDPFLAHCLRPCVLHVDGTDNGGAGRRLRRLCSGDSRTKQRTDGGDPKCKWREAHPSRKMSHRLRSAGQNKPTHNRRAISGRRSARQGEIFTESGGLSTTFA